MEKRTYRTWVDDKDLVSFTATIDESDLFIRAQKDLGEQAQKSIAVQRAYIKEYIKSHPEFATSLVPVGVEDAAPAIIQDMARASAIAEVGPMASVAGAVAEYVGKDLLKHSSEVIVENGGDIFLKTEKVRKIGIFAGKSCYTGKLALEISPTEALGICTSSGTVGHSLSFGKSDAAIVVSHSASIADAWATRLGNMVGVESDIEKVLDFIKKVSEILGVVLIVNKKIGMWGDIKLIKV